MLYTESHFLAVRQSVAFPAFLTRAPSSHQSQQAGSTSTFTTMSGPLFPSAALSSNEATVPAPQRPQAAVTVSSVLPHRGNSTNGGAEVSATETSNSSSTSSGLTAVASTDSSKAEKQLARVETEDVTASDDDAAPSSSSSSSSQDNARCPRDASKCVTCSEDKLTGWADWVEAAKLVSVLFTHSMMREY